MLDGELALRSLYFLTLPVAVVGVVVAAAAKVGSILPLLGEGANKAPGAAPTLAFSKKFFAVNSLALRCVLVEFVPVLFGCLLGGSEEAFKEPEEEMGGSSSLSELKLGLRLR